MTKADTKRPSATRNHRAHPYQTPSSARPVMHPRSPTPDTGVPNYIQPNTSEPHSSTPWPPAADDQLMQARQQGLNWLTIAETYFPQKTANACRKRHERLIEKRNNVGDWNGVKFEEVARAYREVREDMWRILADRVNEKWSVVESKCMERGLKNLASMGRTRKDRSGQLEQMNQPDLHDDSGLVLDTHSGNHSGNEAGADDQHPFSAGQPSAMSHLAAILPLFNCPPSTKPFQPPVFREFPPSWGPAASR
ncbi:MAG: hypothetical protein Q9168_003046 [Polycauliona sp. 1 TL-2023]